MADGTIRWFSAEEGYGVILDGDTEVPVHKANFKKIPVVAPKGGDHVTFQVSHRTLGPEAVEVVVHGRDTVVSKRKGLQRRRPSKAHTAYELKGFTFIRDSTPQVVRVFVSTSRDSAERSTATADAQNPLPVTTRGEDLGQVMMKAKSLWPASVAETWLKSPNAFLDGARPIDVAVDHEGVHEVLGALDAEASGQFA